MIPGQEHPLQAGGHINPPDPTLCAALAGYHAVAKLHFNTSRKSLRCRFGRHDWIQVSDAVLCATRGKQRTICILGATEVGSAEGEWVLSRLSESDIDQALDVVDRMQAARNAEKTSPAKMATDGGPTLDQPDFGRSAPIPPSRDCIVCDNPGNHWTALCTDCARLYCSDEAQARRDAWHSAKFADVRHPVMRQWHRRRIAEIASEQGQVWHEQH